MIRAIRRKTNVGREVDSDLPPWLGRLILWLVLTPRRPTSSFGCRHPRGWPSTAFASASRHTLKGHNRLFNLFTFLPQFAQHLHYVHLRSLLHHGADFIFSCFIFRQNLPTVEGVYARETQKWTTLHLAVDARAPGAPLKLPIPPVTL